MSLVLLGLVARNRRIMGRHAIQPLTQVLLGAVVAGFVVVTNLGLAG